MHVVIRQVDLDSCLTALICGVGTDAALQWRPGGATADELADRRILCIEAGGAGDVAHGNFDHHDTSDPLPPACVQAWRAHGGEAALARLVAYVAAVDEGRPPTVPGWSLSRLFSGLRLAQPDPCDQLRQGLGLLRAVLREGLDPFAPLPDRPAWRAFRAARLANDRHRSAARHAARVSALPNGVQVGHVQTDLVGALGLLYSLGSDIGIAFDAAFGAPTRRKFTVGASPGTGRRLDALLLVLNAVDPGWGGPAHGTVIGSSPGGSCLPLPTVVRLVERVVAAEPPVDVDRRRSAECRRHRRRRHR